MSEPTLVTRSISLDPGTDQMVLDKQAEIAKRTGKSNYSAALREIIRDWHFMTYGTLPEDENGGK
jgi:hypothetical protein